METLDYQAFQIWHCPLSQWKLLYLFSVTGWLTGIALHR